MTASGGIGGAPLRVGVVGARTRAQGIGPYVARAFGAAGCEVAAIVGTSQDTVDLARADLSERFGIEAAGYTDVRAMLGSASLDVLAICSPADVHKDHLQAALDADVHALCEKPLWWGGEDDVSHDALEVSVRELAEGFLERGKLLALNTQWPYTLPTYRALFPGVEEGGIRHFQMNMSPTTTGARMVVDAGPHLLSMLFALVGPGTIDAPYVQVPHDEALILQFRYHHAGGETDVMLRLRLHPTQPRPAGYCINGHFANREIEPIGYRMALSGEGRREELPDPLDLLVADYAARAGRGEATDVEGLVESMTLLRDLVRVAEDREPAA